MGTLERLRANLLEMTDDEKLARIRAIRGERRISHNPAKAKREKVAKVKSNNKIASDLAALAAKDPEALRKLLESM